MNYFDELQEGIRDINLAEQFFIKRSKIFAKLTLIMIQKMSKISFYGQSEKRKGAELVYERVVSNFSFDGHEVF